MSRYSDLVMSLAPVAYWRLGEAAGTVAVDQTGLYPGTYVASPTLGVTGALAGDPGTAVTFNGTSQRITTALTSATVAGGAVSVVAWVKPTDLTGNKMIACKWTTNPNVEWQLYRATSGVSAQFLSTTSTNLVNLNKPTCLTAGTWAMVAFTALDGGEVDLYVDGALGATGTMSAARPTTTSAVEIAARASSIWSNDTLDEIAIFPRALTAAEIAQLYATGTGAISGTTAVAQAIALRYDPAQVQPPTGYRDIRASLYALPDQLPPTPCVLVFPEAGDFTTGQGTRTGTQSWTVRFYYDQAMDLPRQSVALMAWLDVLTTQLRASAQLGGLVDRVTVDSWSTGVLTYADQPYAGIELKVSTTTSESWSAAA